MDVNQDTIAAVSTPPGRGGIGIVRVSGPNSPAIAAALLGEMPRAHRAVLRDFRDVDGSLIDRGLALFFPAPHSFTGEDVLELHGHGSPVVLDMLLLRIFKLGARPARPGEFSERAFLNDKLDLAQAEAVADLIDSGTREAARAALRSLEGEFSHAIDDLVEALTELRVHVEAAIDFPDEEVDLLSDGAIGTRLEDAAEQLRNVEAGAAQGRLLRDGITVVIAGRPNAGKSSLLNRLAQADVAIVTDQPGTTRDVLASTIQLDGLPLTIYDTAGLRPGGDAIEREGMRRARARLESADLVLLVIDDLFGVDADDTSIADALPAGVPVCRVYNKIDLTGRPPGRCDEDAHRCVAISAATGAGFDALATLIKAVAGYQGGGHNFLARRRHLDALARADEHLARARQHYEARSGELIAEELRLAQQALGEITGAVTSEDLLGRIFSSFCIGK
ncbi:MAG TPA: tRNA uridine-5-carboxymethylaminomethyl(34) synthesis GTPase MnmE [Gammaproteobacteria bacterium]|nr:tRNA uridine-5-carboxymethylaminomethyl(34) synthesis GTPase MnmE [Gammaproteobacteria bacterium]